MGTWWPPRAWWEDGLKRSKEEPMGDVKDAVKGPEREEIAPDGKRWKRKNLIGRIDDMISETARHAAKKDEDARTEGEHERPKNVRKASQLRSVLAMLRGAKAILEDY